MHRIFKIQIFALLSVIAFYTIYAQASSARPTWGYEGANAINGREVSNVRYHLETGAAKSSAVEFDLDAPASAVKVSVNSSRALFFDCVNTNGAHWYCTINPEIGISEFDELRVISS